MQLTGALTHAIGHICVHVLGMDHGMVALHEIQLVTISGGYFLSIIHDAYQLELLHRKKYCKHIAQT